MALTKKQLDLLNEIEKDYFRFSRYDLCKLPEPIFKMQFASEILNWFCENIFINEDKIELLLNVFREGIISTLYDSYQYKKFNISNPQALNKFMFDVIEAYDINH